MPPSELTPVGTMIVGRATLVDDAGPLKAWVERVVRKDPDIRWIVGNYVEADIANDNGHIFPLDDLLAAQHTIAGKPLNMLHRDHYIVGCFAGAQLVNANGTDFQAADARDQAAPFVEAVAGMWHTRFPEEYFNIQKAHKDGSLFFSMEAIPEEVSCPSCSHRAVFAGTDSDTYCDHMRGPVGPKVLHNPTFAGGAIIIPPARPGWSRADIKDITALLAQPEAEAAYAAVTASAPHLDPSVAEALMAQIVIMAREFSNQKREQMSKKGTAMPDGSFPIANEKDLKNAIRAVGRAKNPAAAKAHIKKRAKALGLSDLIPDGW